MPEPQVGGTGRSGGRRADRQARAAVATLQVLLGALLAGAVTIGPVAVLVLVVVVQVVWVAVAGRVLGVTFSGRALVAASALVATGATVWQLSGGRSGRLLADAAPGRLGVLAPVLGLVVVAAVFVQLARRDGRTELTMRLAGTVLVAVLGVLPAALLAATTSAAGRAGLVVLAVAVVTAGAATGLGAGALGTGGLGSGVPRPDPATGAGAGAGATVDAGGGSAVVPGLGSLGRRVSAARARRAGRVSDDLRARNAVLGGAAVAAVAGALVAVVAGVPERGPGGTGAGSAVAGAAVFVVLGVLAHLTALAAGTVARATPSTRTGGLVAASLAVALATPLVLVATRLVR